MSDKEDQKATVAKGLCTSGKDLIRQLQTLSPEELSRLSEQLQPSEKSSNSGVKCEPYGLEESLEQMPIVPKMPKFAMIYRERQQREKCPMKIDGLRFEDCRRTMFVLKPSYCKLLGDLSTEKQLE